MPHLHRATGLLLLMAALGLGVATTSDAGIANGPVPRDGTETMPLEELWRIGGPDDEENLLGVVNDVLADDDGNVYLLDIQLVEVQVFDAEGIYVRSLGKRGDGPGEARFVTDTLFMPDGTLGLVQPFPGRIVKVDLTGVPAGEVRPGGDDPTTGGFRAIRAAAARGNELVISGTSMQRNEGSATFTHFVEILGADGAEGTRFQEMTGERDFGNRRVVEKDEYFPHENLWALGPDGQVALVPARDAYRVDVFGADGVLQRTVSREYASVKRTDAESERAQALMMPWRRRNRDQIDFVMEATLPDIEQVRWGGDGRLWVLPSRGTRDQAPGIHSTWDVFAPDGTFERQVAFACDADGRRDAIFFPGGDLVVVVKEHREALWAFQARGQEDPDAIPDGGTDDARPLEVVCYRLAPTVTRPAE